MHLYIIYEHCQQSLKGYVITASWYNFKDKDIPITILKYYLKETGNKPKNVGGPDTETVSVVP